MGRLRLRTGLAVLTLAAVLAVLAVGAPAARDRWNRWRDRAEPVPVASAVERVDAARRAEAQASIRYLVGGGEPAHAALPGARSRTDRAGRRLRTLAAGTPQSVRAAVHALVADSARTRTERAAIDRRTISDDRALAWLRAWVARAVAVADASAAARGTGAERRTIAALARARAALAAQDRALTVVLTRARLTPSSLTVVRSVPRTLAATLDPARDRLRAAGIDLTPFDRAHARTEALARIARGGAVPFWTAADWQRRAAVEQAELDAIAARLTRQATRAERAARRHARDALRDVGVLILGAVVLVAGVGFVLHRRVRRPVRALTRAVADTADSRAADRAAPPAAVVVPPVARRAAGDVGALVAAIGRLDRATLDRTVTAPTPDTEQLVLDLVRRHGPMLDRQLELLAEVGTAEVESLEGETARLAARMRRNGDRLLVVAGLDPARRRGPAMTLTEVVRVAVSQVEHFSRVDVTNLPDDVMVDEAVAGDLTHVVAELLENGVTFSAPDRRVFVRGRPCPDGVELTVADDGSGMPVSRLDACNELLTHPPMPGLDLSPTLGLIVVARLAERIGATVRLRSAPGAGTSAIVVVPDRVLVPIDRDAQDPTGTPGADAARDAHADSAGPVTPPEAVVLPAPTPSGTPPGNLPTAPAARGDGVHFTAVPLARRADRDAGAGFRPPRHRRPPTGTLHPAPAWPRAGASTAEVDGAEPRTPG